MSKKNNDIAGLSLILIATLIWGYGYTLTRNAMDRFSVHALMTIRYLLAFVVLGICCFPKWKRISRRLLMKSALIALLLYISQLMQTMALGCADTTAGRVAFITALYIVLVPFVRFFVLKSKIHKAHIMAAFLALPGLFLLTGAGGGAFGKGDCIALYGSVGFTIHILAVDKYTSNEDVWLLSVFQFGFAGLYAGIVQMVAGAPMLPKGLSMPEVLWPIIYLGIFSTMLGFLMQLLGQARLSPEMASIALSTEAAFGMIFSVILADEKLTIAGMCGCILMLLAILTAQVGETLMQKIEKKDEKVWQDKKS